ncbi:MAG TPA: hypothetical protein EYQ50_11330, partial [Verrucomicrobiales bacterium]|nr:hypothetical protein [Verrucomicrobiales bacterium]
MANSNLSLKEHLLSYGIKKINSDDEYFKWASGLLTEKTINQLNNIREPLQSEAGASREELIDFYDFVALPKLAKITHSMKADALCCQRSVQTDPPR